ncbi:hypothetical protein V8F06_009931 [Rhypophila decipiens]
MRPSQVFTLLLCSGSAMGSPMPSPNTGLLVARGGKVVTAQAALEAIMPKSTSCDGQLPECRTAAQAAPFLIKAMENLSLGQIAAMLALIGLESEDMRYKHNISPGRPGQGTSNMMMADFTKEYAISKKLDVDGKDPNEILALVTPDEFNFGSAPWFFTQKCTKEVQDKLLGGTQEGWLAYMTCVGVDGNNESRMAYWTRAQQVFGLNGL